VRGPCELCHPIRMALFKVTALNFVIPSVAEGPAVRPSAATTVKTLHPNYQHKVRQPFKLCHPERSRGTCSSPLGRNHCQDSPSELPAPKVRQPFRLCHPERSRGTCSSPSVATEATMSRRDHHYYVYIVASRSRVLYCGLTNSVARRTEEHRAGLIPGFTADYKCHRLVWFEHYRYVHSAIDREKEIKRWTRAKKIELIEETNPSWADLSEAWRVETAGPSAALRSGRDDKV
jgi:putative endonuclease